MTAAINIDCGKARHLGNIPDWGMNQDRGNEKHPNDDQSYENLYYGNIPA